MGLNDASRVNRTVVNNANTAGNNTLIAAQVDDQGNSVKIRVCGCKLNFTSAATANFQSGAGGTSLTGAMAFAANGQYDLPFNEEGWFETAKGDLLNVALSTTAGLNGVILWKKA